MTSLRAHFLQLLAVAAGLVLSACASPATTPVAAPAPSPAASTDRVGEPVQVATVTGEPGREWQLLDEAADHVPGISADRAYRDLLVGMKPKQPVLVAVIDGGVDTAHADLRSVLWMNPSATAAGDGARNMYPGDVHGWNFIGGRDGRDVHYDTYELTRVLVLCNHPTSGPDSLPLGIRSHCDQVKKEYDKQLDDAQSQLPKVKEIDDILARALPALRGALGSDSLTVERVRALHPTSQLVAASQQVYLQLAAQGITPEEVRDARKDLQSRVDYGLNLTFNPRGIVGDDYSNFTQRDYGNPDVMGPDAKHGTHVAGIIGAARGNGIGIDGIAPDVRILMVRAVPDGDERDKDIANAIRFAVDNGARVINMSFGKPYSPQKWLVDDAVRYADSHGVLMIHAAGNDGQDEDQKTSYPTPIYLSGGRAQNWIEVGASSWRGGDSLAASFTNYGRERVDVFAPGVDILSTVPGDQYERDSGTSMATPVVTGLAALLLDYYPQLTAADVKRIILTSATPYRDQMVARPGSTTGEHVTFGSLSATGAIVNAYAALLMAREVAKR